LLQFQEYFEVVGCDAITHYLAGWGCGALPGDWCQSAGGSSIISMATGVGNFSAFSSSPHLALRYVRYPEQEGISITMLIMYGQQWRQCCRHCV
jgi:hypothetical protein